MPRKRLFVHALLAAGFLAGVGPAAAEDMPAPESGFKPIFDGKTLEGWEGDPVYWRVENGALTGVVTPETVMSRNSFIIWRGGVVRDFELKLEYRVSGLGNSGVNYRSTEVEGTPFAMKGYQADIDGGARSNAVRHTGQNYEERGRTFLARRGQMVHMASGAKPEVFGSLGDTALLASFIKEEDWNELHVIARGNVLVHILNGHAMALVVDDDSANRRLEGLIGVQVHVGPPMKIEYLNIRLKRL
ncbi:MAG TPA: DUF1080 domain-containing protein [Opitutaceae bacterium]